jgi:RND family efflux transporter MFP subunit
MKKRYKIIIGIILILAVAGYMGMEMLTPLGVSIETAAYGDLVDTFTVQGKVMPQKSVIINATASGTVLSLPFKPGMTVQEGQEVARIATAGPAELEIQKEQLRQQLATAQYQYQQLSTAAGQANQAAALEAAQSALALAEQQYQAALAVEAQISGVYTPGQLAELENAVVAARQALVAAQSQGATAADRNYYSTLISSTQAQLAALEEAAQTDPPLAPFSGVVWQLLTEEGSYINKHQPILSIYQSEPMKIEASLLSEDTLNLQLNEEALLRLSDGRHFNARVSFISPVAEQVISSLGLAENRCLIELEPIDLPESLGAGHQLDILFARQLAENALSVPASAIVPLAGGSAVYVAEEGKARLTPVQTGVRCGGRVEITGGLAAGDAVITDPYEAGVKDGSRVEANNAG